MELTKSPYPHVRVFQHVRERVNVNREVMISSCFLMTQLKDEKVAIVKMDATANDVPAPFEVHGFPTIYWAPKNAKDKPVKYQGGRELSDFLDYISTHSTDGLSKSKDEL